MCLFVKLLKREFSAMNTLVLEIDKIEGISMGKVKVHCVNYEHEYYVKIAGIPPPKKKNQSNEFTLTNGIKPDCPI